MIKVTQIRERSDQPSLAPDLFTRVPAVVFQDFVIYEIGYGCQITELEPTRVACATHIMGCLDKTIFEGTAEEMALICEAASWATLFHPMNGHIPNSCKEAAMQKVVNLTGGNPMLIALGGDMYLGANVARSTLLAMVGDIPSLPMLVNLKLQDLCTGVLMLRNDKVSLPDVLSLLTPVQLS